MFSVSHADAGSVSFSTDAPSKWALQVEYGVPIEITLAGHVIISTRLMLNLHQAFYRPGSEVTTEWGTITSDRTSREHMGFAANVPNVGHTKTEDSASSGSVHAIEEAV